MHEPSMNVISVHWGLYIDACSMVLIHTMEIHEKFQCSFCACRFSMKVGPFIRRALGYNPHHKSLEKHYQTYGVDPMHDAVVK